MKLLLLSLTLLSATFGFSQNQITLTLNGLSDEANASLQPGEYLLNLNRLDEKKYIFYARIQNADGGSSKYVKIKDPIQPNTDGKYDFSIKFDVQKTGSLDFSKDIKVTIEGKTTLGNDVWVEKVVAPADFGNPIVMDGYGNKNRTDYPPKKKMKFSFAGPRKSHAINSVVVAAGDELKDLKYEDFHFKMKNVDSEDWLINDSPVKGSIVSGRTYEYKLDPADTKIDITKQVVVSICAKTKNGGAVWGEFTLEPWELGGTYFFAENYSAEAPCSFSGAEVTEEVEEETEEVVEETEEVVEETEEQEEETAEVEIIEEPVLVEPIKPQQVCIVDSLTKQLTFEGNKLCVNNVKVFRGTTNTATLLFDTEYTIGGNTYILAGGKKIQYHNKQFFVKVAHLKEAAQIKTSLGTMDLAADREIEFSQKDILKVKLSKDATLNYKGGEFVAKAGSEKFDIELDKLGRLSSLVLGADASWNVTHGEVKLPTGSYIKCKNDQLYRVKMTTPSELTIGGATFSVVEAKKGPSLEFESDNVLKAFVVGSGHSTTVDGQEITMQSKSEVELTQDGSGYIIASFVTAEPFTIDVYKGSKVKSTEVKAGKRLIIEEGKVVKVK